MVFMNVFVIEHFNVFVHNLLEFETNKAKVYMLYCYKSGVVLKFLRMSDLDAWVSLNDTQSSVESYPDTFFLCKY